jgi:hypothetical protein
MARSRRVEFQNDLTAEEYATLTNDNVEDLTELRLWSLEKIKENKAKVAHAYNKKVKPKEFCNNLRKNFDIYNEFNWAPKIF